MGYQTARPRCGYWAALRLSSLVHALPIILFSSSALADSSLQPEIQYIDPFKVSNSSTDGGADDVVVTPFELAAANGLKPLSYYLGRDDAKGAEKKKNKLSPYMERKIDQQKASGKNSVIRHSFSKGLPPVPEFEDTPVYRPAVPEVHKIHKELPASLPLAVKKPEKVANEEGNLTQLVDESTKSVVAKKDDQVEGMNKPTPTAAVVKTAELLEEATVLEVGEGSKGGKRSPEEVTVQATAENLAKDGLKDGVTVWSAVGNEDIPTVNIDSEAEHYLEMPEEKKSEVQDVAMDEMDIPSLIHIEILEANESKKANTVAKKPSLKRERAANTVMGPYVRPIPMHIESAKRPEIVFLDGMSSGQNSAGKAPLSLEGEGFNEMMVDEESAAEFIAEVEESGTEGDIAYDEESTDHVVASFSKPEAKPTVPQGLTFKVNKSLNLVKPSNPVVRMAASAPLYAVKQAAIKELKVKPSKESVAAASNEPMPVLFKNEELFKQQLAEEKLESKKGKAATPMPLMTAVEKEVALPSKKPDGEKLSQPPAQKITQDAVEHDSQSATSVRLSKVKEEKPVSDSVKNKVEKPTDTIVTITDDELMAEVETALSQGNDEIEVQSVKPQQEAIKVVGETETAQREVPQTEKKVAAVEVIAETKVVPMKSKVAKEEFEADEKIDKVEKEDSITSKVAPAENKLDKMLAMAELSDAEFFAKLMPAGGGGLPEEESVPEGDVSHAFNSQTAKLLEELPPSTLEKKSVLSGEGVDISRRNVPSLEADPDEVREHEGNGISIQVKKKGVRVDDYLRKARDQLNREEYSRAEEYYIAILMEDGQNKHALFGLAATYHKMGRLEEAGGLYHRILKKDPTNKPALNNLIVVMGQESPDKVLRYLHELQAKNPSASMVPAKIGLIYAQQKRFDEAIDFLSQALKIEPHNVGYLYQVAVIYDNAGHHKEAIQAYQALRRFYDRGIDIPVNIAEIQERLTFLLSNVPV